jgi:SH3-like domain-containing protein
VAKWVWARDADAEAKFIAKPVKEGQRGKAIAAKYKQSKAAKVVKLTD